MRYLVRFVLVALAVSVSLAQTRFELLNESIVQYEASDVNATWQGRAPVDSVALTVDESNLANSSLRIVIKADKFGSGNIFRDADARRVVFEVRDYPEIVFEATGINTELATLQEGSQEIQLSGNLIMHGVTKPLVVTVTLELQDSVLKATGGFEVLLSDFEMRRPSLLGITVDDLVKISFDIQGSLQRN
jgi:polyisoprenoid-binding protein YceI